MNRRCNTGDDDMVFHCDGARDALLLRASMASAVALAARADNSKPSSRQAHEGAQPNDADNKQCANDGGAATDGDVADLHG